MNIQEPDSQHRFRRVSLADASESLGVLSCFVLIMRPAGLLYVEGLLIVVVLEDAVGGNSLCLGFTFYLGVDLVQLEACSFSCDP
jgi:hypothetical protein